MNKNKLLLFFFIFSICGFAQQNKSTIKNYLSNYQISETDGTIGKTIFKIVIDDKNLNDKVEGFVKLIDQKQKNTLINLKTKYFKTVKDKDGTTYWFHLYGNEKFNVLRVCNWSEIQNIEGKNYKSIVIFSLYEDDNRISDLGMLCNKIN